jgi:small-conductance mechanosensitive channel
MSNDLFKPHKSGSDQNIQQAPTQEPAASGISLELLEKIASLLKGIETMNGKIADNYDVIDEMRSSLRKLHDQLQNIEVPDTRLDEESREIISAASKTISNGINDINAAVNGAGDTIKKNIEESASQLSKPLNKLVDDLSTDFKTKISKAVEKKVEDTTNSMTWAVVENWLWRSLFLVGGIAWFLVWLYPQIEDIQYPKGALGVLYTVLGILIIPLIFIGVYKWGKSNGNSWY